MVHPMVQMVQAMVLPMAARMVLAMMLPTNLILRQATHLHVRTTFLFAF
jgi:hypothetical protein